MYGLLLENLATFIKIQWGEGKWESVRRHAGVDSPTFSVHHVYAETLIPRLARSAVVVLGVGEREFFEAMGVYFVEFMGQYGYDQVMSVLGRHMRDFLNGLDNLHEYLKFSYPRMRAPSFYCDNETVDGLTLHYRSKRRGFVHYAMGQIKQVGKHFYDTNVGIELLSEEMDGEMMHVKFQLKFDNRAYGQAQSLAKLIREEEQLPVKASMFFELFPFCVVFCHEMIIRHTGHSLVNILPELVGQTVSEAFDLVRPVVPFAFSNILERRNVVFELVTVAPIIDNEPIFGESEDETGVSLRLKGQMLHMEEWKMMIFLATPQMPDLDSLLASGLYINDLSLHDCSRDLVLAGTQQSVELKLALDQEQQKSRKLEDSMKQLDLEMKRTDELLYQMIPKQVADRIRRGENPVDTCEVFDVVSILFSDVVTFTEICSRIKPMQVVQMLNHMYSLFDQLTERNGVYKVETIGDAYMVVSGAPNKDANHAERICDMALDMVDASRGIKDPSGETDHLQLRVGVHSGDVVAGVVGIKMPRYCLFGDAVNTSSRMESSSAPSKIQISETTKALLPKTYLTEFRGEVAVKGKGQMSTFWLNGRRERIPLSELTSNSFSWTTPPIGSSGGQSGVIEQFRTPAPSLDDVRGKTFSESSQSSSGPPLGRLVKEPTISGSGRPTSRSGLASQDSFTRSQTQTDSSTSGGHIPFLTHQPSISNMNLNAIRAAVTEALKSKSTLESYPGENKGAPPPFVSSSTGLRSIHSGSISDLRNSRKPSATQDPPKPVSATSIGKIRSEPNAIPLKQPAAADPKPAEIESKSGNAVSKPAATESNNTANEPPVAEPKPKPTEPKQVDPEPKATPTEAKPVLNELKAPAVEPKEIPSELKVDIERKVSTSIEQKVSTTEPKPPSTARTEATASEPVKMEPSKPLKEEPIKLEEIRKHMEASTSSEPQSKTVKVNSGPSRSKVEAAQNQMQDNVASISFKATLGNSSNNISGKSNLKDGDDEQSGGKLPKKERLVKRLKENKVALLTSDVMTQMGCNGFVSKQKEVISQACSLL